MFLSARDRDVLQVVAGGSASSFLVALNVPWARDGRSLNGNFERLNAAGLVVRDGKRWSITDAGPRHAG
jgi:hypothetical protein